MDVFKLILVSLAGWMTRRPSLPGKASSTASCGAKTRAAPVESLWPGLFGLPIGG